MLLLSFPLDHIKMVRGGQIGPDREKYRILSFNHARIWYNIRVKQTIFFEKGS